MNDKIYGSIFGHPVTFRTGNFYLLDGKTVVTDDYRKVLKCPKCDLRQTKDGHDPCIANLKGVEFACCGHGQPFVNRGKILQAAYIKFEGGEVIRFDSTEELLEYVKINNLGL